MFAFFSAFSISPSHVDNATIVLDGDDLDEEETDPTVPTVCGTQNEGHASSKKEVEWFSPLPPPSALPPLPFFPTIPSPITSFKLHELKLLRQDGQAETVVYEGVMPDGLTHTVQRQDGTHLNVHDAHLCLKMQANLTNIP